MELEKKWNVQDLFFFANHKIAKKCTEKSEEEDLGGGLRAKNNTNNHAKTRDWGECFFGGGAFYRERLKVTLKVFSLAANKKVLRFLLVKGDEADGG